MRSGARLLRFRFGDSRYAVLSFEAPPKVSLDGLTDAEGDVLTHILEGRSNKQIAKRRKTSERTVANQVASLFKKLSVSSRAELVARLEEQ